MGLGGPAIIAGLVSVVRRWFKHREKMKELDQQHEQNMKKTDYQHEEKMLTLAILYEDGFQPVTLDELLLQSQEENK